MTKQTKQRMKRVNYHLTERQVKLLRMYSVQTGLSVAEVIRRCVDEWLEETEQLILMLAPHCTKKE